MEQGTNLLSQILGETEATAFAKVNGRDVYTFRDVQKVNQRILAEEKLRGKSIEAGERQMQADGIHFTKTKTAGLAANPEVYFANRYRVSEKSNGKPQIEVVLDYRAIKEQATNRVYTKNVNTYVLGRAGKGGNGLTLIKKDVISDIEFVNEFKNSIPIYHDGGINTQIVAVYDAIERAQGKEENHEDLEKIFG